MFKFLSSLFASCDHDWQEIGHKAGYFHAEHLQVRTRLYCPRCDKTRYVSYDDWEFQKKEKNIKSQYKSK